MTEEQKAALCEMFAAMWVYAHDQGLGACAVIDEFDSYQDESIACSCCWELDDVARGCGVPAA